MPTIRLPMLALASSALLGLASSSCSILQGAISRPPTIVARTWQVETVLGEPGNTRLVAPSVVVGDDGRPAIAVADHAFYVASKSVVVARRAAEGWRVEFPLAATAWRVCAQSRAGTGAGTVLVTHGELEGPLSAFTWDGATMAPGEPGPCTSQEASVREVTGATGVQKLERSSDHRTLWHRVTTGEPCGPYDAKPDHQLGAYAMALDAQGQLQAVVFEHPRQEGEDEDDVPLGRLLHSVCQGGQWTSSVVTEGVRVREVDLLVDGGGQPHLAYVVGDEGVQRLVYAVPADAGVEPLAAADRDARVLPAVEACLRVYQQPSGLEGMDRYQKGDGFGCAVLERDAETSPQALALLGERCDAGSAEACAVAGSLHHWFMGRVFITLELPRTSPFQIQWEGLRPNGLPEDPVQAAALYGRACEQGDARGCLSAAVLLPPGDERRIKWAFNACDAGLAHGCALTVALTGLQPKKPLARKATDALSSACDQGDQTACASHGVMLALDGKRQEAQTALQRACEAGVQPACRSAQVLK